MDLKHWFKNSPKKGQGLTEYLILLILVALVSIAATKSLGSLLKTKLKHARDKIQREVTFQ